LSQSAVLKDGSQVQGPLTDIVVALEQIKVPSLNYEKVIWTRGLDVEELAIVERCIAVLAAVMGVSHLFVLVVDVTLHEDVACAFKVFAWHVLGVHDAASYFVVKDWLWLNIPNLLLLLLRLALWLNFEPASDDSLRQRGAVMVNLAVLDGLLFESLPVA